MLPIENTKLYGFEKLEKSVLSDFYKDKLHHSLLITGIKGTGKATFAYKIANHILSTKKIDKQELLSLPIEIKDLNSFNQTYKLIKSKAHPDFLVIECEPDPKTKKMSATIKVDAIREINEFINLTSSLSDYKVIVIDSADEMNVNAQNAILKVLEEPNKDTFLILISHNSNKLLDTIKSRCREIRTKALDYENWKNALLNYLTNENIPALDNQELELLFVISNSSVSFAINIIELDGLEFYEQILNILSVQNADIENMQTFTKNIKSNDALFDLFKFFINFFFERLIKIKLKDENCDFISENEQKALEIIANKNGIDIILGKFEFIKQILSDVERLNLDKSHCLGVLLNRIIL